jgi:2-C-methyl-D-erythritol 2,4-cyclodiphosphate synthase
MRIGFGWDLHRLAEGRPLMIGGIRIPFSKGEDAHSDGDVLLHAVVDALLGALALGDIGSHFPPSEAKWKDADSRLLLEQVREMIHDRGYRTSNLDSTVLLEAPKLGPHIKEIRENLAELLFVDIGQVSVKAKSHENIGHVGKGEAVEAYATVLVEEADPSVWT